MLEQQEHYRILMLTISRSKEKLNILGNFDMMLNGWTAASSISHRKSPARNLAYLVESKYGKIIDTQKILISTSPQNYFIVEHLFLALN
jgi:hypothetical protein